MTGSARPPVWRALRLAAVALAGLAAAGCAASRTRPDYDPLQPVNRAVFRFNDTVDRYAVEPVARVWRAVLPDRVERAISDFFANVLFPVEAGNCLLQLKPRAFATSTARFLVNTTVGLGGFLDPATGWGLPRQREDFGQTLGVWGLPPGAYIVLPLLGPSNVRDVAGLAGDYAMSVYPFFIADFLAYTGAATTVNVVNARAQFLDEIANARAASLDYYAFVRNAYFQRRRAEIADGETARDGDARDDEDLYEIED